MKSNISLAVAVMFSLGVGFGASAFHQHLIDEETIRVEYSSLEKSDVEIAFDNGDFNE